MNQETTLSQLLQSKSRSAKIMGFGIALFMFVPSVCRVAGDLDLTIWQRIEQLSLAAGQTLLTVAVAAVPPEALSGSRPPEQEDAEPQ